MIRRIREAALIFVVVGICSACGASRPVKYYVLDSGPAPVNASSTQLPITLLVTRITAPLLYRDDRLVFGSGSVRLGTYEYERWAESPAEMVQDMLVSSLRSSGQYRSVARSQQQFSRRLPCPRPSVRSRRSGQAGVSRTVFPGDRAV